MLNIRENPSVIVKVKANRKWHDSFPSYIFRIITDYRENVATATRSDFKNPRWIGTFGKVVNKVDDSDGRASILRLTALLCRKSVRWDAGLGVSCRRVVLCYVLSEGIQELSGKRVEKPFWIRRYGSAILYILPQMFSLFFVVCYISSFFMVSNPHELFFIM